MNEEVVNLFHEVIDAMIIVVSNPPEEIVNGFFQEVLEVCSKRTRSSELFLRLSTQIRLGTLS